MILLNGRDSISARPLRHTSRYYPCGPDAVKLQTCTTRSTRPTPPPSSFLRWYKPSLEGYARPSYQTSSMIIARPMTVAVHNGNHIPDLVRKRCRERSKGQNAPKAAFSRARKSATGSSDMVRPSAGRGWVLRAFIRVLLVRCVWTEQYRCDYWMQGS